MVKFRAKNMKGLQTQLTHYIANNIHVAQNLQHTSAEIMRDVIEENVYDKFNPKEYERRGDNNGFSDIGGIRFTDIDVFGNKIIVNLENTNVGSNGLSGEELTDMFENGIKDSWEKPYVKDNEGRTVSDPRPFIEDTIEEMNLNKPILNGALAQDLKDMGFKIK